MADDIQSSSLETLDPDLHVAAFFVPPRSRADVLALMVFEVELARIATQVSEPMVAQIRYAWWREQVDAILQGRPVLVPTAVALGGVVSRHRLPRVMLDDMIDAHARDCDTAPFSTIDDFEVHGAATFGNLMKLACRVLGAGDRADQACMLAGKAYGAARQLQGFSHWCHHRRLRVPLDGVLSLGLSEADVFSDAAARQRLMPLFDALKQNISKNLIALNRSRFPRAATPVLSLASLARPICRASHDPLQSPAMSPAKRVMRLAVANLLWRF